MYYKNVKTPTLEYGRRAPPHHCWDKDGGGRRKMSRGRQKQESSIPSSNTHPSPKSDGPCWEVRLVGGFTRNQSEKDSKKYTTKSWNLNSVLVKSWQRKCYQENCIFGNAIDAKISKANQNDTLQKSQMDVGIDTKRPKREETDV